MKRTFTLCLLAVVFCFNLRAQITFAKRIQHPFSANHYRSQVVLSDSSLVLAGYSDALFSIIMRLSKYGDTLWTRKYDNHYIFSVTESADGNVVFLGSNISPNNNSLSFVKMNKAGQIVWQKAIGQESIFSRLDDVIRTSDKGFILIGHDKLGGQQNYSAVVHKTDSLGNILWSTNVASVQDNFLYSVIELPNHDLVATGQSYGQDGTYALVLKLNGQGTIIWSKRYLGSNYSSGKDLTYGGSGQIFVVASYGTNKALLMVLDTSGTILSSKSYNSTQSFDTYFLSTIMSNNQLLMTGILNSTGATHSFLLKTNLLGDTIFTRQYRNGRLLIDDVVERPGEGYLLSGECMLSASHDWYTIAVDTSGKTSCTWAPSPMVISTPTLQTTVMTVSTSNTYTMFTGSLTQTLIPTTISNDCALCFSPDEPSHTTPQNKRHVCRQLGGSLTATGTGTINWYSSLTSTLALGSGSVYVISPMSLLPGPYTYYIESRTCASSKQRTAVNFTVFICEGIEERMNDRHVRILPNPATEKCTLYFDDFKASEVNLFNNEGKHMRHWNVEGDHFEIREGELGPGIYFVKVSNKNSFVMKKLVVVR